MITIVNKTKGVHIDQNPQQHFTAEQLHAPLLPATFEVGDKQNRQEVYVPTPMRVYVPIHWNKFHVFVLFFLPSVSVLLPPLPVVRKKFPSQDFTRMQTEFFLTTGKNSRNSGQSVKQLEHDVEGNCYPPCSPHTIKNPSESLCSLLTRWKLLFNF